MGIPPKPVAVRVLHGPTLAARLPRLTEYVLRAGQVPLSRMPAWLNVLRDGLRHTPYAVEAVDEEDRTLGYLPLAYVNSFLFGVSEGIMVFNYAIMFYIGALLVASQESGVNDTLMIFSQLIFAFSNLTAIFAIMPQLSLSRERASGEWLSFLARQGQEKPRQS